MLPLGLRSRLDQIGDEFDDTMATTSGLTQASTPSGPSAASTPLSSDQGLQYYQSGAQRGQPQCTCGKPSSDCFCSISPEDWVEIGNQVSSGGYYD